MLRKHYISDDVHIVQIPNTIESSTIQDQSQLKLYASIKSTTSSYLKNKDIALLSQSLMEKCDPQFAFLLYNEFTQDLAIPQQLLNLSNYVPPQIPEIMLQIPHSVDNRMTWKEFPQIQYEFTGPSLLVYEEAILFINKPFKKTDFKIEVDLVYLQKEFQKNLLISQQPTGKFIVKGINLETLKVAYYYQEESLNNRRTKLCAELASRGFVRHFLLELDSKVNFDRINVKILLYDALQFDRIPGWSKRVFNQQWLQSLNDLSFNQLDNSDRLFHQVMLSNLEALHPSQFSYQLLDLVLVRLGQYFEAQHLDLKHKFKSVPKKKEEVKVKTIVLGKKPKGVGYGGSDKQEYIEQIKKKKEILAFNDERIFTETDKEKWQIARELFRILKQIDWTYIELIEDSALIPIIKSILQSLCKTQLGENKFNCLIEILNVMRRLLDDNLIHLYTIKIYGNISLCEILERVSLEAKIQIQNTKDEQFKQILKSLIDLQVEIELKLQSLKYITITYEQSEQQLNNVEQLYPIIMKSQVLKTSIIITDEAWLKKMGAYYSLMPKTPPKIKMNRLITELTEIADHLPLSITNSIFLRYDKERMDAMQTLIIGSSGTPYAHGAFLYQMLFCDDYPARPPKCLLETTGHGKVRFNPNLYNCGKVCLSLLGTWGDNWVANKSTLLQILISIQAMVMSEYVYYNEPGWESSMGTPEGDQNNRGYCNIVKLANIRYAMIEQLQKPPQGFEEVIQKSFYLRKEAILKEIEIWAGECDLPVNYNCTQNQTLAATFIQDPSKFKTVLLSEIEILKKELEKLKITIHANPGQEQQGNKCINYTNRRSQISIKKARALAKEKTTECLKELLNSKLEYVDVEEQQQQHRQFDSSSSDVQNLMSRYIGVMGLESVTKQSQASVLLLGLNSLGIETAKNLVLSGLKRLTIIDGKYGEHCGQFFKQNEDSILKQSLLHLQGLNPYVEIDYSDNLFEAIKTMSYQIVCICEIQSLEYINQLSAICREFKIKLIVSDIISVYGRIFVDFGPTFEVLDTNGEQNQEIVVENITHEGVVTLKSKHTLQTSDIVEFREIISEGQGSALNGQYIIKVLNSKEIQLADYINKQTYLRNGRGIQVKQKLIITMQPLSQIYIDPIYDPNFMIDESKFKLINSNINKYIQYRHQFGEPLKWEDTLKLESYDVPKYLAQTALGVLPPQAAYLGGVTAQEIIKAITHKYMPIQQSIIHSCEELLDLTNIEEHYEDNSRYRCIEILIGQSLSRMIAECKLFMIGAGAIGCELLKNYAMLGLGRRGKIIVTDPDVIENSNLSRQFLFREKHIRKPKSITAANACLKMNNEMQLVARLDRVGSKTEEIYSNKFFEYIDVVTNALDNVAARLYVDQRCVQNQKGLVESGTLGPKGHVQVIVPFLSESYGSKEDPNEENDIPYCTLKMFPEESIHCLEWARDKFEKMFFIKIQSVRQCLMQNGVGNTEMLETTVKYCKRRAKCYRDCVQFGMNKFQKYFNHGIRDLLQVYPLEHEVNGKLFWSSPKRPPHILEFKGREMELQFIRASANLYAEVNNIQIEKEIDLLSMIRDEIEMKQYRLNEDKLKQIEKEVVKQNGQENTLQDKQQLSHKELIEMIINELPEYFKLNGDMMEKIKELDFLPKAISFEKDEDQNGHIDFIQAGSNCRAQNYNLEELSWLETKLKAGKIVPAMATTTSTIAGLQTIETIKLLKQQKNEMKFDQLKNSFVNLAIPYQLSSEPGECEKLKDNLSFWNKYDCIIDSNSNTIQKLINYLEFKHNAKVIGIKQNAKLVYEQLLLIDKSELEIKELLDTPLEIVLDIQDYEQYVEIDVNFNQISIPKYRLWF